MSERPVVVLGGSGFLGRRVVVMLAASGRAVCLPTRRLAHAQALSVLPRVEVREYESLSTENLSQIFQGAEAVISLIGILNEERPGDFERVHAGLPKRIVEAARMSALNANAAGPSEYLRS
jgi:NADH dehydrogenase